MAFIPHSEQEIALMLDDIGVQSCLDLFDEIPSQYQVQSLSEIPEALDEQALIRLMNQRQSPDQTGRCFLGAGAYDHFIPTACGSWLVGGSSIRPTLHIKRKRVRVAYKSFMSTRHS